ncbi:hypothetical protein ACRE_087810 [Hapsidospora chrysogenum ATCC 11550]|uniref:DNA2/NAM7 helicase-like C-terminal domain-containing protein n=1 Tax=Hapsidospora chrysogenum (strain ATCC 11550 / CBS 779.69 / DSM 880 / IAM 14645 / JCM 23072 / IMI 49137) TaxID=857340 RepID=A0A086STU4_HAPC1|nr:hypothetical protein ACRE_087810 [Hapsidospora chrysogenum ATCC 11550]
MTSSLEDPDSAGPTSHALTTPVGHGPIQSAVILINDALLAPYNIDYIRRLGSSDAPGPRTTISAHFGKFNPQAVTITLYFRDRGRVRRLASMGCNVHGYDLSTTILSRNDQSPDESDHIPLHVFDDIPHHDYPDLAWARVEPSYHQTFQHLPEDATLQDYIWAAHSSVIAAQCVLPSTNLSLSVHPAYLACPESFGPAQTSALTAFCDLFKEMVAGEHVSFAFFLANDRLWDATFGQLSLANQPEDPYREILRSCRQGEITDLDFVNCELPVEGRNQISPAEVVTFANLEHAVVTLIGASVDESYFAAWAQAICSGKKYRAVVFGIPNTEWEAEPGVDYGVEPDQQPTQFLVVTKIDQNMYLPSVGTKTHIRMELVHTLHPQPQTPFTPEQRLQAVKRIVALVSIAQANAANARDNEHRFLVNRRAQSDDDDDLPPDHDISCDEEGCQTKYNEVFEKNIGDALYDYVDLPRDPNQSPDDRREALVAAAIAAGRDLIKLEDEDKGHYHDRVAMFVDTNATIVRDQTDCREIDQTYRGFRIDTPPGIGIDVACYIVSRPTQPWSPVLTAPYIGMQNYTPLPLNSDFRDIIREELSADTIEDPNNHLININVDYGVDITTNKVECAAVNRLMNLPDSAADRRQWFHWTVNFNPEVKPPAWNLFDRLPGLHSLQQATTRRELRVALAAMAEAPAGVVVVRGDPGTGKTRFALDIIHSNLTSETSAHGDASQAPALTIQDHQELDEQLPADVAGLVKTPAQAPSSSTQHQPLTPGSASRFEKVRVDSHPATQTQPSHRGLFVHLVGANTQVDDAAARLSEANPGRTVIRAYMPMREIAALLQPSPELPEPVSLNGLRGPARDVVYFYNHSRLEHAEDKNPHFHPLSVNNTVRGRVRAGTDPRSDIILNCHDQYRNSRTGYILNHAYYREQTTLAAVDAICHADIVVCTPVAWQKWWGRLPTDTRVALVIVDEAAAMPEPMALIAPSLHPNTPIMLIGDNLQTEPVSTALGDKNFQAYWPKQRTVSLVRRFCETGNLTAELHDNLRTSRSAGELAQTLFYPNMNLAKPLQAHDRYLHTWLRTWYPNLAFDNIWITPLNASDQQTGDGSWINPLTARGSVRVASLIYRQSPLGNCPILIITPYRAQMALIQRELRNLSPVELPPGAIEVRTVDSSPSHQAPVVVFDITRTSGPGFLDDTRRLSVAVTRAQSLTVFIGNVLDRTLDSLDRQNPFTTPKVDTQSHQASGDTAGHNVRTSASTPRVEASAGSARRDRGSRSSRQHDQKNRSTVEKPCLANRFRAPNLQGKKVKFSRTGGQAARIEKIKEKAASLAGGSARGFDSSDMATADEWTQATGNSDETAIDGWGATTGDSGEATADGWAATAEDIWDTDNHPDDADPHANNDTQCATNISASTCGASSAAQPPFGGNRSSPTTNSKILASPDEWKVALRHQFRIRLFNAQQWLEKAALSKADILGGKTIAKFAAEVFGYARAYGDTTDHQLLYVSGWITNADTERREVAARLQANLQEKRQNQSDTTTAPQPAFLADPDTPTGSDVSDTDHAARYFRSRPHDNYRYQRPDNRPYTSWKPGTEPTLAKAGLAAKQPDHLRKASNGPRTPSGTITATRTHLASIANAWRRTDAAKEWENRLKDEGFVFIEDASEPGTDAEDEDTAFVAQAADNNITKVAFADSIHDFPAFLETTRDYSAFVEQTFHNTAESADEREEVDVNTITLTDGQVRKQPPKQVTGVKSNFTIAEKATFDFYVNGYAFQGTRIFGHSTVQADVMDGLGPNLLLGTSSLYEHGAKVDFDRNQINLPSTHNMRVPSEIFRTSDPHTRDRSEASSLAARDVADDEEFPSLNSGDGGDTVCNAKDNAHDLPAVDDNIPSYGISRLENIPYIKNKFGVCIANTNPAAAQKLRELTDKFDIYHDKGILPMPDDMRMRVDLADGWQNQKRTVRAYPLGLAGRKLPDLETRPMDRQWPT